MLNGALRWYLAGTASFLVASGTQVVLFPWLVAVYLHESPTRVGLAQMAAQLPMLLLILWGGWLGDRVDQRRLLITLQALMALPPLVILVLFNAGIFNFTILFCWALVGGTFAAFAQPTRDALLNRVAGTNVQRVVILSTGIQFGVQILGFAIGSTADSVGPPLLLVAISIFMLGAAVATQRIPELPPISAPAERLHPLTAIAQGMRFAWHDARIRPAVIQTFSVGIFFAGAYLVLIPLMVRDLYAGGSAHIAGAFAANMLGTVCITLVLMRVGQIRRPGRLLLAVAGISAMVLSLLFWELPLAGFYLVVFLWGTCGGVGMSMSRSIVQEAAPAHLRARILSVYSLGLMGGMPIGSFTLGVMTDLVGVRNAVLIPVVGMLLILLYLRVATQLWHVTSTSRAS